MRGTEAISASDATPFSLTGGKYAVIVQATFGGGSAKLQILMADGSTYISVASATDFTADGFAVVDLPPGKYKFLLTTASALVARVVRIPGD